MIRPPPSSPLFPYTTLSRSQPAGADRPRRIRRRARQQVVELRVDNLLSLRIPLDQDVRLPQRIPRRAMLVQQAIESAVDRKSTRLNSSHLVISYAVFCLKKK